MLRLMIALLGGSEEDAEILLDAALADIFLPIDRSERLIKRAWTFFRGGVCHIVAPWPAKGRARREARINGSIAKGRCNDFLWPNLGLNQAKKCP
jgi:hypothetical protein